MNRGELKRALLGLAALENTIESTRELGSDFEEEYMNAVTERTRLRTEIVAAFDALASRNQQLEALLRRFVNGINDEWHPLFHTGYPLTSDEQALLEEAQAALEEGK
ncbi:MAG: hypothetical protein PHZ19_11620 [Candidatus Thermoplasmatota archaeon]|nr:hypothetical protein [Candidatus Thermoplasmatota archaeon]